MQVCLCKWASQNIWLPMLKHTVSLWRSPECKGCYIGGIGTSSTIHFLLLMMFGVVDYCATQEMQVLQLCLIGWKIMKADYGMILCEWCHHFNQKMMLRCQFVSRSWEYWWIWYMQRHKHSIQVWTPSCQLIGDVGFIHIM